MVVTESINLHVSAMSKRTHHINFAHSGSVTHRLKSVVTESINLHMNAMSKRIILMSDKGLTVDM